MTLSEARKLCKKWQARLKMSDLKIHVRYPIPEDKFDPKETTACCWWHPEFSSRGLIIITKKVTEHDIVHELLHFRLEGHTDLSSKEARARRNDAMYERAINALAQALTGTPE